MRILVIHNLKSGASSDEVYGFIRAFAADGDEVVIRTTAGETLLEELVHDCLEFDTIVASGGDGTAGAVTYAVRNSGIPVLIFPSGTANLLAMNLDNGSEPVLLARTVKEGASLPFDLGEIEYQSEDGTLLRKGFILNAGAGYDAKIIADSEKTKETLGVLSYFAAALANPNPTITHFTLTIDGEKHEIDGIAVLLLNFSRLNFELPVVPDGDPRDGKFDIAVIKAGSTVQLLPTLISAILDRSIGFADRPQLDMFRGAEITVEADPPVTLQFDGDLANATTPLTARVLHRSVDLLINPTSPYYETIEDTDEVAASATGPEGAMGAESR